MAAGTLALLVTALVGSSQRAIAVDPMAFGAFPGAATQSATLSFENSIGRSLAYVRVYDRWNDTFPNSNTTWNEEHGTQPLPLDQDPAQGRHQPQLGSDRRSPTK
jgi:hypothetical protein